MTSWPKWFVRYRKKLAHRTNYGRTWVQRHAGGGRRWIRTTEAKRNRFTVCPLWPLGNAPIYYYTIIIREIWSWWTDSNPWPADYKSAALPTELHQHFLSFLTTCTLYHNPTKLSRGFKKIFLLFSFFSRKRLFLHYYNSIFRYFVKYCAYLCIFCKKIIKKSKKYLAFFVRFCYNKR